MRVPVIVERDDRGTSSTSGSSAGEATTSGSSDRALQLPIDTVVRYHSDFSCTTLMGRNIVTRTRYAYKQSSK